MRIRLPSAVFAPDGDGAAAPAAAVAPAPAPVVETPAPAPAPVEAAPAAPVAVAPAEAPAPVTDPAVPAEAPAEAKPANEIAPSLLEQGAKPPAPVEPTSEQPADEAAPASTETPPDEGPVSYELAFPDDIDPSSVNDERIGALKSILAESKVPAEKGQELLNLHYEDVRAAQESVYDQMVTAFNEQQAARQAEVKADPQLGGARFDTAIVECFQAIERFGGNEAERSELIAEMKASGMGNSLRFLRFLNNVYNSAIREGSPVPTPHPRAPAVSREARGLNRYSGRAAR